jgi:hypothetical protein
LTVTHRNIPRDDLIDLIDAAIRVAGTPYGDAKLLREVADTADAVGVGNFTGSPSCPACPWAQAGLPLDRKGAAMKFAAAFDDAADAYVVRRVGGPRVPDAFYVFDVVDDEPAL